MKKVQNHRLQAKKYNLHKVLINVHETKKIGSHETEVDRLSNLPDDIIRRILSLVDTRSAVQTCLLSKQWKHYWTEIESIQFDDRTFNKWRDYAKYIRRVLRCRKPFRLRSLTFNCSGRKDIYLVSRIFNYARKHNVEVLETDVSTFSPRLYECKTLKTLTLGRDYNILNSPNPFGFKSITTLQLVGVWLSYVDYNCDLFSSCLNLKNLILLNCQMYCPLHCFNIGAPELAKLTISNIEDRSYGSKSLVISAPKLKFFDFQGRYPPVWRSDECSSLEIVDIQILLPPFYSIEGYFSKQPHTSGLLAMAEGFNRAKSVTISFEFAEGKLILYQNCSTLETKTKVMEINKDDIGREWPIDLAQVRQRLDLIGFHMKWMATRDLIKEA